MACEEIFFLSRAATIKADCFKSIPMPSIHLRAFIICSLTGALCAPEFLCQSVGKWDTKSKSNGVCVCACVCRCKWRHFIAHWFSCPARQTTRSISYRPSFGCVGAHTKRHRQMNCFLWPATNRQDRQQRYRTVQTGEKRTLQIVIAPKNRLSPFAFFSAWKFRRCQAKWVNVSLAFRTVCLWKWALPFCANCECAEYDSLRYVWNALKING